MMFDPYILLIALCGALAAGAARLFLPGAASASLLQIVPLGIAVSLLAGLVGWYAMESSAVGFALAVLATVGVAYLTFNPRKLESS